MELIEIGADADAVQVATLRVLMREYADMPHTAGRWTTAAQDIAALPHPYVRPHGIVRVARDAAGEAVACGVLVALEPPAVAEIKRVYVRPAARGRGVGEVMMRALLADAVAQGYAAVRLDTAPDLVAAQALYRRLGFVPIPSYKPAQQLPGDPCFELPLAGYVP